MKGVRVGRNCFHRVPWATISHELQSWLTLLKSAAPTVPIVATVASHVWTDEEHTVIRICTINLQGVLVDGHAAMHTPETATMEKESLSS